MIHWKISTASLVLGAATTFGFVWLARSRRKKVLPPSASEPVLADPEEEARADALRDLDIFDAGARRRVASDAEALEETLEPDFADSIENERIEFAPLEGERATVDDAYDAVDPEGIGTEYLRRATEAPVIRPDESAPFEEPESDAAPELPVGNVDADGNTELHSPHRPSKAAVELPPNDDELARRAEADPKREGSG